MLTKRFYFCSEERNYCCSPCALCMAASFSVIQLLCVGSRCVCAKKIYVNKKTNNKEKYSESSLHSSLSVCITFARTNAIGESCGSFLRRIVGLVDCVACSGLQVVHYA